MIIKKKHQKLLCIFEGKNTCGKMAKNNCQENEPIQPLQSGNIWGILLKTIFPLPLPRVLAGAEGFAREGVTHGSLGETRRFSPLSCRRVGHEGQTLCRWCNMNPQAHARQLHSRKAEICHAPHVVETDEVSRSVVTCSDIILIGLSH